MTDTATDSTSGRSDDLWTEAEVIHAYPRSQALADGVLVAVPAALAAEAGIRWPVALTAAAWSDAVAWTEAIEAAKPRATAQDETGRLWDVLTMVRYAMGRAKTGQTRVAVNLVRVPPSGRQLRPTSTLLDVVAGPGDDGAPVLTVMLPGED